MNIIRNLPPLRDRLYESYVSQHSGQPCGDAVRLAYRSDIRPYLPARSAGLVLDIGCRSGQPVRCRMGGGYDPARIDVKPRNR